MGTVSTPRSAVSSEVRVSDLGAVIHKGCVPDGLPEEIPSLYNCLFSTLDYQVAFAGRQPDGCCLLAEPRHVLLLSRAGAEIDVLNRALRCSPEVCDRVCRALFRAYPDVRRVRLEVAFSPVDLSLPWTQVRTASFMRIDLPASTDEYFRSLGKSTRKTIRGYRNRLARDFPDLRTETVSPDGSGRQLVERLVGWKMQRFREQERTTYWETHPELVERTVDLLERLGWCRVTYIGGEPAAIHVCFRVGDTVFGFEGAHDPAYDAYRLGFLTMYEAVCAAIEAGASGFNAMEGAAGAKEMLGARPVVATHVTIHRSGLRRRAYLLGGRVSRRPGGAAVLQAVRRWRGERAD